jgi:3-hydroxyisobutyrate dehydrogenase-like beta-hydroxyacid dehydrogenase
MTATVGIIGLGNLGLSMSKNLMARGHRVVGFRRSAMTEFAGLGGIPAASPREVAEKSDFVITSLPSGEALAEVCSGTSGIARASRPGLAVFELSTLPLAAKLGQKEAIEAAGMTMLDGTISGNPVYFANRTAAVFIGGERGAFDDHAATLRDMTDKVTWLGPFGAGRVAKFVALYLVCAHTLAAAEAFELASRAGLDREAMFEAIKGSNASSAMLESRGALMIDRDYSSFSQDKEGRVKARAKDGDAAPVRGMASRVRQVERLADFAHELGGRYPLLDAMNAAYGEAIAAGVGRYDIAEVFEHLMADAPETADIDAVLALLARRG